MIRQIVAFFLVCSAVVFGQDAAPEIAVETPKNVGAWAALLAIPLLSLVKIVLDALPQSKFTDFVGKIVDFFMGNIEHKK